MTCLCRPVFEIALNHGRHLLCVVVNDELDSQKNEISHVLPNLDHTNSQLLIILSVDHCGLVSHDDALSFLPRSCDSLSDFCECFAYSISCCKKRSRSSRGSRIPKGGRNRTDVSAKLRIL